MSEDLKLRVWYVAKVPGTPIHFDVESVQAARIKLEELAHADMHNPDVYSNAMGLEVFEEGEWMEWYDDMGFDIHNQ